MSSVFRPPSIISFNHQLLDDVVALTHLLDAPKQVAGIHADGALHLVLEAEVTAHGLPVAVEGQTDEVALADLSLR